MDEQDNIPRQQSVAERQLRRLVVPAPAGYGPSRRIDIIHSHNHGLDLLCGPNE